MNRILDRQLLMQEFSGYDSIPELEAYLAVSIFTMYWYKIFWSY